MAYMYSTHHFKAGVYLITYLHSIDCVIFQPLILVAHNILPSQWNAPTHILVSTNTEFPVLTAVLTSHIEPDVHKILNMIYVMKSLILQVELLAEAQ